MGHNHCPPAWGETRVRCLIAHHERQTDVNPLTEDETAFEKPRHSILEIPTKLDLAVNGQRNARHRLSTGVALSHNVRVPPTRRSSLFVSMPSIC